MHPIDWITGSIIDSAMRIHSALGPGHFESVYEVLSTEPGAIDWRPERRTASQYANVGAPSSSDPGSGSVQGLTSISRT
jgi:hypothetical protein